MNRKIGIFDSGLGGLSVVKEIQKILPHEDLLFYEDSAHNPYGEKSEEELFEITSHIVDYLLEKECKMIVIACNTATTSCMKKLREKYPDVIFVGTVPAVKMAYDNHSKNTLVLATPYTKNSKRVLELIEDFHNPDQDITCLSGENLANLIEFNRKEEIVELLHRLLDPYKGKVDTVVLGCTHYPLILDTFQEILPGVKFLDGGNGVAREVKHQLEEHHLSTSSVEKGTIEIINTKDDSFIERSFEILSR